MSGEERAECKQLIAEAVSQGARREKAAEILGLSLRTLERWDKGLEDARRGPHRKPSHALTPQEAKRVLEVANSQEFADLSPWQIVPRLADKGEYVASESSFYRILRASQCLTHRSKARPRAHARPEELVAKKPNEVWSWDITYLKASIKGKYYYLYLPIDIFSRMIVHWEVHETESAQLASQMIGEACRKQGIQRDQIVLHSDNGGAMKGATMLATLQRLGVIPSFSRPKVSDDNPFSESLFKTLKYCHWYPQNGFESLEAARNWVEGFVYWYNHVHFHSGIQWVSPASRQMNQDEAILKNRSNVYQRAQMQNPSRWSGKIRDWSRMEFVELNSKKKKGEIELKINKKSLKNINKQKSTDVILN